MYNVDALLAVYLEAHWLNDAGLSGSSLTWYTGSFLLMGTYLEIYYID